MNRDICTHCAAKRLLLKALHESSLNPAPRCDFCHGTTTVRRIEWLAKPRKLGTAALAMMEPHFARVGVGNLETLSTLASDSPETADTRGVMIGPLIRHGLVEMAAGKPQPTAKGRDYLIALRLERFLV